MTERKSAEDKFSRRVFRHLEIVQLSAVEKSNLILQANPVASEGFRGALSESLTKLLQHISHPDTDLDTVDIHGWPWPNPADYPPDQPVTLTEALEESIGDNPDLFDEEAPADPAVDPRDAELEALRARVAELEASPPPSPAVVALEGMEALRAKIDGVRKTGSIDTSGVDDLEPLTPDDLINMVADNPPGSAAELENTVRVIRGEARRRFTELLNVELSGLEQERAVGSAHANPKREQQIEYLLGLFARLGEI